jgi:hypothetical protein
LKLNAQAASLPVSCVHLDTRFALFWLVTGMLPVWRKILEEKHEHDLEHTRD